MAATCGNTGVVRQLSQRTSMGLQSDQERRLFGIAWSVVTDLSSIPFLSLRAQDSRQMTLPSGIIWDIVPTTINSECLNFRKSGNRYHHFVVSYSKRFLIIWLAVAYVAIYIITFVWCIFSNCYFALRMLQHKLSKVSVSLLFDAFLIIWLGIAYVARYIVKSSIVQFFFSLLFDAFLIIWLALRMLQHTLWKVPSSSFLFHLCLMHF